MEEEDATDVKTDSSDIYPFDFDPTKKKKKKIKTKKKKQEKIANDEEEEEGLVSSKYPWEGTDRDYEYKELLGRVFSAIQENNPELAREKNRTVMRPPQLLREGPKKTVCTNFMDICRKMHRQPEDVMTFLVAEMETIGALDRQQQLVVKGTCDKNFEGILRKYINEYVLCGDCRSPDTILSKENGCFSLRCQQCGSGRSIAPTTKVGILSGNEHKKLVS